MNNSRPYRVLVVEDEALISMLLEDMLKECGFEVVGAITRLEEALALIACEKIDIGLLDINLGDGTVYPVADAMHAQRIPFIFSTGYSACALPPRFEDRVTLQKPFSAQDLRHTLLKSLPNRP